MRLNKLFAPSLLVALALCANGQPFGRPAMLRGVGIDQRLNTALPLEARFVDEAGQPVRLGQYFRNKPVLLALVYYECPMLCNMELSGLVNSLQNISLQPGEDFEVVVISFDSRETPPLAAAKKRNYVRKLDRPGAEAGMHFLTGESPEIKKVADAAGFHFAWDHITNQFAHASAIMLATPEGRMSRYFYGIKYSPRDLRLGLVEASNNKIGSPTDQVLLFCFHYDPTSGKYGFAIVNILRVAGSATALAIGAFVFVMFRRERRNHVIPPTTGGGKWRPV
jgi:protein SCO1/2